VPRLFGHFGNEDGRVADAGVVDEDIEPAEAGDGVIEELLDVGAAADVAAEGDVAGIRAGGVELGGGFVEMGLLDVDEGELRAFASEAERDAGSDAAAAAGDQCYAVLEDHSQSVLA
jgi:hypothetical protein